ncbi:MAG: ABC transporter permease [Sphingomonadales bacterium]|nr:ABC transporter permease [Sphingomonadales bacterium]
MSAALRPDPARLDPRRLRALLAKELTQILRDPSTFLIALVLPLLLLFLFGYAVSLDTSRTRIALVLEDSGAAAQSLAQAYENSRYFDVALLRASAPAKELMVEDRSRGIVVIPQDFSRRLARGTAPVVQVITDGSQPNTAGFVAAYAKGVLGDWAAARRPALARALAGTVTARPRFWYNPGLESRNFLVPGAIAIVMTMIGTLLTALVVAREWERGTMEAMIATPMTMAEFVLSKVVPYFLLALAAMAMCTVLAVTLFGVPFRGSVLALALVSSAFLLPALGLGLFVSTVTRNQFVASQIALLASFLPTFLLSGFLYEISSMPAWIRAITFLVPARYLIPPLQTIFLVGDVWPMFWRDSAIMAGFGVGFFMLSLRATRRSLD